MPNVTIYQYHYILFKRLERLFHLADHQTTRMVCRHLLDVAASVRHLISLNKIIIWSGIRCVCTAMAEEWREETITWAVRNPQSLAIRPHVSPASHASELMFLAGSNRTGPKGRTRTADTTGGRQAKHQVWKILKPITISAGESASRCPPQHSNCRGGCFHATRITFGIIERMVQA